MKVGDMKMATKVGKCKLCDFHPVHLESMASHLEREHHDLMPPEMDGYQYFYYLKTGKDHSSCIVCKHDTLWNPKTMKYSRFCTNPKCKEKYREEFKLRMIGKYGKIMLLNDPEQQKKMLANRSISGIYVWSDGTEFTYTGSYEKDFLEFLDLIMDYDSSDIFAPSPHTYYYIYENERKFYIPDVYIASLNTEIEIKDGGDNPNNHHKIQAVDKVKEKLKDEVMRSNKDINYLKVINKNNMMFFKFLEECKNQYLSGTNKQICMI